MVSVGSSLPPAYQPSALTTFTARSISISEPMPPGQAATRFPPVDESDSAAAPGTEGEQAAAAEQSKREQLSKAEAELALIEQQEIAELAARDREVRAHEQAHVAVGGQHGHGIDHRVHLDGREVLQDVVAHRSDERGPCQVDVRETGGYRCARALCRRDHGNLYVRLPVCEKAMIR